MPSDLALLVVKGSVAMTTTSPARFEAFVQLLRVRWAGSDGLPGLMVGEAIPETTNVVVAAGCVAIGSTELDGGTAALVPARASASAQATAVC